MKKGKSAPHNNPPNQTIEEEDELFPEGKKKSSLWRIVGKSLQIIIITSLIIGAVAGGVIGGILYNFYTELPNIARLEEFRPSLVSKVYDRNDELIGEFFIEKRALVTFEDLPKNFIHALLAVEDKRFFSHFGIDVIGFGRALLANIKAWRFAEGASTITQQLTRLLFLSPEKKLPRKIKEWMLAVQIEQRYKSLAENPREAKEKILELYTNQYYFGHGAYGIRSAATLYFGKTLEELDLGECAMLAGILQRPAPYSPILHPEAAKKRQAHVLDRMVVEGYIEEGEFIVNEETLKQLEALEVPEDIRLNVAELQGQRYETQEEFSEALSALLDAEELEAYQSLILIQAAEVYYTLTEESFSELQQRGFPEELANALTRLTGQRYQTQQEFVNTLENALGAERLEQYQGMLVNIATHETAKKARVTPFTKKQVPEHQINKAPYFVEHVRQYLEERYGWSVYRDGLQIYTTLDLSLQQVAQQELQEGLRAIQKRHGFKLIDREKPPEDIKAKKQFIQRQEWRTPLEVGEIVHGFVTAVTPQEIQVQVKDFTGTIGVEGFKWAGKNATEVVQPDDIILVEVLELDEEALTAKLRLDMEPFLEGALMSIDPKTGYILAMVGGYDFYRSKFNRAVQAPRQPGSSFKPFVYLTALERGFTPADIVVDEPVTFVIDERTGQSWTPRNFSGTFRGPMRLRQALEKSVNAVAAKLIDMVGPHAVIETARKLGISSPLHPYPSLALGSSEVYLQEMVSAYCAFANQGFRVEPIFVTKVLDHEGNVLEENSPRSRQVLAEDTTYILVSMMQGVVERGTSTAARKLGRPLAGKTGTTNDNTDAWFVGYSPSLVAGVWVGHDQNRQSIGRRETGGRAALPIWIGFMEEALKDSPVEEFPVPAGVNFVQIDTETGLLAAPQCSGEVFTEVFKKGTEPREYCYQYRPDLHIR